MLPRLLGSDIHICASRRAILAAGRADASQLEQVIANLAIHARDAMPRGGRLTISTGNTNQLPSTISATARGEARQQDWLVLEVAHTGCGMDEATRNHVFEPFFTTKPVGRAPHSVCPPCTASSPSSLGRFRPKRPSCKNHFVFNSHRTA